MTMTVAELIRQAVTMQIAARSGSPASFPPEPGADGQVPDEIAAAVELAWSAFERRAYLLVIDGKIARQLREEISCQQDHKVTFLRLVPLVGG
jgi:hypothetical protein